MVFCIIYPICLKYMNNAYGVRLGMGVFSGVVRRDVSGLSGMFTDYLSDRSVT